MRKVMHIGTRDSQLALWQTSWVKESLSQQYPKIEFPVLEIKTKGDKILDTPLAMIGDKGLFTKELDNALLEKKIDFAVHSLKDLPTKLPNGIELAAISPRGEVRDAFLSKNHIPLAELKEGATIATGSLRRKCQLLAFRPDLKIVDVRGNLQTRLKKWQDNNWDGMILAAIGLQRLNLDSHITELISPEVMIPAVGQGSLGVVCRSDDQATQEVLNILEDKNSKIAATTERSFLRSLEGGCQVPIGANAQVNNNEVTLVGCIGSIDGQQLMRDQETGPCHQGKEIGQRLAERMLQNGGKEILEKFYS